MSQSWRRWALARRVKSKSTHPSKKKEGQVTLIFLWTFSLTLLYKGSEYNIQVEHHLPLVALIEKKGHSSFANFFFLSFFFFGRCASIEFDDDQWDSTTRSSRKGGLN
jgi:hypothetical protein